MEDYLSVVNHHMELLKEVAIDATSKALTWLEIQRSYGLPEDFMWSAGLGIAITITLFLFANKQLTPEEKKARLKAIEEEDNEQAFKETRDRTILQPATKKASMEENSKLATTSDAVTPTPKTAKESGASLEEMINPEVDDEELLKKTRKLAERFGATEENVRDAIAKVKDQQRRGLSAAEIEMEEPFIKSAVKGIEWIIFIACIFGLFFCLNIYTHGDAGRMAAGIFPRELELLGMKDSLERYGLKVQ